MTSIDDRPNSAVLVIDMQVKVVIDAVQRDAVISSINSVVTMAREAGVPVFWVQHESDDLPAGTQDWKIVPELMPVVEEALVAKQYGDSFEDTELEAHLARLGVGHIVVTGAQTDACVRSTMHGAFTRGYDVTLVADGHTTSDLSRWGAPPPEAVIQHTNLYWSFQTAPGRTAKVVKSEDLVL